MDDQQFRQLLDFFGLSWKGYRKVRERGEKALITVLEADGDWGVREFCRPWMEIKN